jgi:hypothetical protein
LNYPKFAFNYNIRIQGIDFMHTNKNMMKNSPPVSNIPLFLSVHPVFQNFVMYSSALIADLYDNESSDEENGDAIAAFLGINLCKSRHFNDVEVFGKSSTERSDMAECFSDEWEILDSYWNWEFDPDEQEIASAFVSWRNTIDSIYVQFGSGYGFYAMLSIIYVQLNVGLLRRECLLTLLKQWFEAKNRDSEQTNEVNMLTLSFCITCKNRFHQIEKTLKQNLDDNRMHKDRIEFILVDFDSTDGLHDWVAENFKDEINDGYLKYYYTEELPFWHASIAKNTAHLLANNEILVNLDCDNYTGYHGGEFVLQQFSQSPGTMLLHQFSGQASDGSFGRIGVHRHRFFDIGGYDESMNPMSIQDYDLIMRLQTLGIKYVCCSDERYGKTIPNTKEEGILYTGSELDYMSMLVKNRQISEKNLSEGKFAVNNGEWGIRKNIFDVNGLAVEIK